MATLPKSMPLTARVKISRETRTTSVAEAKANFSALINRVEQEREEIVVKRRGVAVAKVIPFTEPELPSGYGWMRGSVEETGDIVGPTGEEWDAQGE